MTKEEMLNQRIRDSGGLLERLEDCRKRIGKMCSERRGPRMSIPVEWNDDDYFICLTIRDAIQALMHPAVEPPANPSALKCPTCKRPLEEVQVSELREYFAPAEERTPIDSPSEVCPLVGCRRRDDHQHVVIEHPNRPAEPK